jgi:hypothetical protein
LGLFSPSPWSQYLLWRWGSSLDSTW